MTFIVKFLTPTVGTLKQQLKTSFLPIVLFLGLAWRDTCGNVLGLPEKDGC